MGLLTLFFLQAEDVMRYLVRSRGLGDVYKRQPYYSGVPGGNGSEDDLALIVADTAPLTAEPLIDYDVLTATGADASAMPGYQHAVPYTHLTLPTRDLV